MLIEIFKTGTHRKSSEAMILEGWVFKPQGSPLSMSGSKILQNTLWYLVPQRKRG